MPKIKLSSSAIIIFAVVLLIMLCVVAIGLAHLQQNDPRSEALTKVLGEGGALLGILFLVWRSELITSRQQNNTEELQRNTRKTEEIERKVETVREQTNGGMAAIIKSAVAAEFAQRDTQTAEICRAAAIKAIREVTESNFHSQQTP